MGLEGLGQMMERFEMRGVIEVVNSEQSLRFSDPLFGESDRTHFLVNRVITLVVQTRDDTIRLIILVRRFLRWSGNDQRCTGLINQNTVYLIHNGVVEGALHKLRTAKFHIIAEIIETKLVVGAIC